MSERYPLLEISRSIIKKNSETLLNLCRNNGIEPFAVVKGFNGLEEITKTIIDAGYSTIASSRLEHLAKVKQYSKKIKTLALRIPMLSELPELIKYSDISLNSEMETLAALNQEAAKMHKIHNIILMRDLGDLREGIIDSTQFIRTAVAIEKELKNLHLYGIGSNLTCYGSIIPTATNLSELAKDAVSIEKEIRRPLEIISGGNTTSIPLIIRGEMPAKINNIRIGEALIVPCDLFDLWKCPINGLSNEALILKAEIIEIGKKPTMPIGQMGTNCFGSYSKYEDRGVRKRALLALGAFDIGDCDKLIPVDKNVKILGASSDHMIIDIEESPKPYKLGDLVSFTLHYQAMLFASANIHITKNYIE